MGVKCMCGYERERSGCTVIQLTPSEKKMLIEQGQQPQDSYYYCPPCLRVMQDPDHGALLMRGIMEQQFISAGVPKNRAKELADEYHTQLIELRRKATHGTQA